MARGRGASGFSACGRSNLRTRRWAVQPGSRFALSREDHWIADQPQRFDARARLIQLTGEGTRTL